MPMMGGMFAMMTWMLLGTLLFIVLVVMIVWLVLHWLQTREHAHVRYRQCLAPRLSADDGRSKPLVCQPAFTLRLQ